LSTALLLLLHVQQSLAGTFSAKPNYGPYSGVDIVKSNDNVNFIHQYPQKLSFTASTAAALVQHGLELPHQFAQRSRVLETQVVTANRAAAPRPLS